MFHSQLVDNLHSTFNSSICAKGRGNAATADFKNIQKAHTSRILKSLDDGQSLIEVTRKMKDIEGIQPQINNMGCRLGRWNG